MSVIMNPADWAALVGDYNIAVGSFSVPLGLLIMSVLLVLAAAVEVLVRRPGKKPEADGEGN